MYIFPSSIPSIIQSISIYLSHLSILSLYVSWSPLDPAELAQRIPRRSVERWVAPWSWPAMEPWTSCWGSTSDWTTHRIHGAGIYANIGDISMVNVTIYSIHGSYGLQMPNFFSESLLVVFWGLVNVPWLGNIGHHLIVAIIDYIPNLRGCVWK